MFSTPTREARISFDAAGSAPVSKSGTLRFSVKAGSLEQARETLDFAPARIYLSAEPFAPLSPASRQNIAELSQACREKDVELYLTLPRMTSEGQRELFEALFAAHRSLKNELDGLLIGHAGVFEWAAASGMKLHCDSSMNLYNSRAAAFMAEQGASGWTPSLELPFDSLLTLPEGMLSEGLVGMDAEPVLHGVPTLMYMDHDVSGVQADEFVLDTGESRLRIRRDAWERYHLLPETEYTLLPRLEELVNSGYTRFRLELQDYSIDEMRPLLIAVRRALDEPARAGEILEDLKTVRGGYSYGAQKF